MRFEDMKNNIPETPDFIHEMIKNEVDRQLQETKIIAIPKKRKRWNKARVAAATIVCVLATTTAAYAGVKMYRMYVEKQGDYSVKTGITSENKLADLPAQIHDINFKTGYIPEGMKWADESHLEYPQSKRMGGFSFASVLLDSGDLNQALENKNVVESEERTFGKYEGVYLKYNNLKTEKGVFDQRIYLLCPDEYRVITIYIGDDVSKEDAVKVAENLEITENDKMLETAKMYTWSDEVNPKVETGGEMVTSVPENKLKVHKIGEDFTLSASGEDKDGNNIVNDKITACVYSVQIADNLKLLNGAALP